MKSYVLREGCRFTLVEETPTKMLVSACVATRDISFEDKELIGVDTVDRMLHFHVGNRHYYANTNSVSVLH
jgi:hypothetical protein